VALHLAERAFALHLLLQGLERLIDVVVADENLNQGRLSIRLPAASLRGRRANKLSLPEGRACRIGGAGYIKPARLSSRDGLRGLGYVAPMTPRPKKAPGKAEAGAAPRSSAGGNDWAERTEQALLDTFLIHVPALGWSPQALAAAGSDASLSAGDIGLLCPNGPRDMAALWARRCDARALAALVAMDPAPAKIREKIAAGVAARLDAAMADEQAARRWAGFLALPSNAALGLKLAWEGADVLWRWAGDVATDENHYSKRAILGGILVPALAIRLADGREAAEQFVAARIENVMQFEKWKAGIKPSEHFDRIARTLSRMRYGSPAQG
jgi:ubiquinone biosynthesis protein COQ9